MKIVVNTRLLIKNKLEGIGWFTFEILKRVCNLHPEHEFIFLFDRKYSDEFIFSENIRPIVINPPARHPVLWYMWFEFSVHRILKKEKPDLFISPDGFLSLRTNVKSVSVIHDINFFHRPMDLPFSSRYFYNKFFPQYARKAHKIITVSEFSKNDISSSYNIEKEKIAVVYNGSNELYAPVGEGIKFFVKEKYTQGEDFFIYIGSMHPRKNITGLFRAFELFKQQTKNRCKLVIVGEKMFMTESIYKCINTLSCKDDIIFTGRLVPEALHEILASAYAMTFVPFYEGFGIPALEAMYCDVPVICSSTSSLPEVTGDAALYVNPDSDNSIAEAMRTIFENRDLRSRLIEKGRKQREKFSWDKTAAKFWAAIEDL